MNYQDAVVIVKNNYSSQIDLLTKSLSPEAIITLAQLCNQNINRSFTDATIFRLSAMEPHRQSGFLANPFLEWIIGNCMTKAPQVPQPTATPNNISASKSNPNKNKKPEPEPTPEPEPDVEPDIDIFDMF